MFFASAFPPGGQTGSGRRHRRPGSLLREWNLSLRFRRLRLVGSQQPILERSAVESADDGAHLFRVRGVDKGESFGFLGLRVPDYLHVVVDEVFCVEPRLDVVLGDPHREVSEKYSKAHPIVVVSSVGDLENLLRGRDP